MSTCRNRSVAAALGAVVLLALCSAAASGQTVLVPDGAVWKYLDDGSNQGMAWRDTTFNDSGWASGPAQLGYGDGDEATVVSYGPDPNNKYITTYFRHSFDVADPTLFSYLHLKLLRDDGAVVYLNGSELKRSNMPEGTMIGYLTLASSTVGGSDEDTFFGFYPDSGDLKYGTNVLAVEIHQRSVTSSDISFDLELIGLAGLPHVTRKAPYLIYNGDNTEMQVLWQLILPDTCAIEWGLDETYSLGSLETQEYGDDHQHSHTIGGLTPSTMYHYRVVAREDSFAASFRTAPPAHATDVSFLVYGDTRSYPADHDDVAAAMISAYTADPNLHSVILCVGDLVNSGNLEDDWDSQFFDPSYTNIQAMLASLPYQACRGNHEGSGILFRKYFPYPYVSPCYWSFDYGPAHFVVIDQYLSYAPGSAQYNWIVADLAATTKPWKFMIFHEPGWSAGGHSNELPVQNYLQPLCLEHDVAAVFAGHNHYYARAVVDGVQHITTGGGGAPLYAPNPAYPNIVATAQVHHFCTVRIDDSDLYFTAISAAGDTIDEFALIGGTSVEESGDEPAARGIVLSDAFPNPFNPVTSIAFSLPARSMVELDVLNANGELVKTLVQEELPAGEQRASWDGTDSTGRAVSSGVYFYRLRAGGQALSRKMVLLK
jgi:hypothetical protein